MRVIKSAHDLRKIRSLLTVGQVGFVPTMGALHEGHISLVTKALQQCSCVIVSVYVNPTQFNDKEDLKKYPRNLTNDLELLGKVMRPNDIVFTPGDTDIYPETDKRVFDFGNLDKVMEGQHRPGHFNGVGQVVSRLFEICRPDRAYFGQKDFQQLTIIKELVRQSSFKPEIISCPIIREHNGLAMSSRNQLLDSKTRRNAGIIYNSILLSASMIKEKEISEIKAFVFKSINNTAGFNTQYFEIVDDRSLVPVNFRSQMDSLTCYYGCVAVMAGNVRLIDNIQIDCIDPKG